MLTTAQLISLIDHTRLNEDDTVDAVVQFCQQAVTAIGHCAAVCVYPKYIAAVRDALAGSGVAIATVVNFPHGNPHLEHCCQDIDFAISQGADEIDIVMPYQELKKGELDFVRHFIEQCKQHCQDKIVKVIIESGQLTEQEIAAACHIVIDTGCEFIKTSTGKTTPGATESAVSIMCDVIQARGSNTGIKVSGGIRTLADANRFLEIIAANLGQDSLNAKTCRLGASQLISNLV